MLKQLDEVYICSQQTCESIPRANVRLASGFMEAYEEFVKNNAPVVGGFTHVLFDGSCARFSGRSETVVANDGFLRASKLVEFYVALREYQRIFNGLYEDRTKRQKLAIAKSLKQGDDSVIRELDDRLLRSGLEESDRVLVKKFLTQYDWWHGQKTVDRDDFVNSPLLQCAKLVAASNGAIPCITQHLGENVALMEAFGFSVDSDLCIRCEGFVDNLSLEQLADELKEMVSDDVTKSSGYRILGLKYPKSISKVRREDLLAKAGLNESYEVEIHKGIKLHELIAAKKWGLSFADNVKQIPEQPKESDRLTVALKLFKEARKATASTSVRCWVFSPGEQANRWDEMRDGGVMALSYSECGRDLREYANEEAIRAEFKSSEEDDASYKNHIRALTDFLNVMKPGDLVFAKKGTKTFLGVGRVTGEYEFAADASDYKHRRAVEWLKVETIERDDAVARKTLTDVTRYGDLVRELREAYGIADSGLNGGTGWSAYWELNPGARQYFDELRKNIDKLDNDKVVEMFTGVKKNGKVVFKPMWSGSYGTGWNSLKRGLEEENSKTIEAIRRYCASAADLAVFATKEDGKNRPLGFGNSVVSELLMKFHPNVAMKCGRKTIAVYHDLHLMEFKRPDDYSAMEYTKALGIAADIRQRMDQLGITRMVEDKESADYLTVNEFIAWCGDNKDLIKEEIMAKEFKKVEKKPKKDGAKKLSDMMKDELLKRLAAALRTKPFAILAGHSGTGKSQMVRRLAYMTCADEGLMAEAKEKNAPGNFCMIQVRPNWHDSTDLLGYYSELGKKYRTTEFVEFVAKAHAYPEIPFFVCLDEMNLAPVEQYFAEYLSAIESADVKGGEFLTDALVSKEFPADEVMFHDEVRFSESKAWFEKHGLTIPKNLFVVGTVNMDDTTCQFSRKVLDRAMTIMMDKVSFSDMQDAAKSAAPSEADLLQYDDIKAFLGGELRAKPLDDDQVKMLEALEGVLGKTPFAVAYRYANEYALYEDSLLALEGKKHEDADADHAKTAMDHCVLMKVLPRVHGERKEMELIFRGKSDGTEKGLEGLLDKDTTLSGKKMEEILARKATYLSFWP